MLPRVLLAEIGRRFPDIAVDQLHEDEEVAYRVAEATLAHYFGLEVRLSRANLCPRIPNRIAYLNIMESLCEAWDVVHTDEKLMVDIGTGSLAIFPLLGAKLGRWIATEKNASSYQHARELVAHNQIATIAVEHTLGWPQPSHRVRYTVSNPPFYTDAADLRQRNRKKDLTKPTPALTLVSNELFCDGGEVAFVKWMIDESFSAPKTGWYSAMVGIHSDVDPILHHLHKVAITNYKVIPIRFGTRRWVVAWAHHSMAAPYFLEAPLTQLSRVEVERTLSPYLSGRADLDLKVVQKQNRVFICARAPFWLRKFRRSSADISADSRLVVGVTADPRFCQVFVNHTPYDDITILNLLRRLVCTPADRARK